MRTKMHRQGWKANMAMLAVVMAIVIMATVPTIHVQAQKIWPVQMDDVTMRQYYNAIVSDFRNGYNSNWSGPRNKTYLVNDTASCLNFYGQSDYVSLILNSYQTELAGMDYYLGDTSAVNGATRLKNMISSNKDTIYLHFAIFSTDNASHTIYTFNEPLTSIQFSTSQTGRVVSEDGASSYYVHEFERDGSWHEYFVPMSEFATILAQSVGSSATTGTDMSAGDMIVSITTVGEAGNMLNLDAIFFCDEAMKRQMQPEEPSVEQITGECGDKLTWKVQDNTLYIFGTGAMWNYTEKDMAPYAEYMQQIESVVIGDSVTSIGSYAFYQFSSQSLSLQLPDGLQSIGENAFEGCSGLYYVTIPNSVQSIHNEAFLSCWNLREVILPDSLDNIPANLFAFCTSLYSAEIPTTVTSIGDNAFYLCSKLTFLSIPAGVTEIYGGAFAGCTGLEEMQSEAMTPPALVDTIDNPVFDNVPKDIPLYVRAKALKSYQNADGWNDFTNIKAFVTDTLEEEQQITVMGVVITPGDSTGTEPVDILGDGTMVYDGSDNTLTVSGADWSVGEEEGAAITYTGEEPLTIVLNDSSTILADTVIASTADIVIRGEGHLTAEGVVPIIGEASATITFDSVNMYVRSVPSKQALRRRIRGGKRLDETGGPALSGFGSADFNKTNVSPEDAEYGPVTTSSGNGEETTINALYTTNDNGEQEVVTEFELTAQSVKVGVVNTRTQNGLDKDKPMYNVLGVQVGTDYHGVVIQNGEKYLLK